MRLEEPKKFEWMKNLHDVLHGTEWMISHGLHGVALDPLKRGGTNAELGAMASNNLSLGLRMLDYHDGVLDFLLFWNVHNIYCIPSTWFTFTLH